MKSGIGGCANIAPGEEPIYAMTALGVDKKTIVEVILNEFNYLDDIRYLIMKLLEANVGTSNLRHLIVEFELRVRSGYYA